MMPALPAENDDAVTDAEWGEALRAERKRRVDATVERDHMRRLFNRLEAAVSHHKRAVDEDGGMVYETWDTALWRARDKILRDYAEGKG